jgi:hypothetical protein
MALRGYAARAEELRKRLDTASVAIRKTAVEYGGFARLRATESAIRPARFETLKDEVDGGNSWKRGRALRSLCAELKKEKWAPRWRSPKNPSPLPSVCPLIPLSSYPTLLVIVKDVANSALAKGPKSKKRTLI